MMGSGKRLSGDSGRLEFYLSYTQKGMSLENRREGDQNDIGNRTPDFKKVYGE